MRNVVIVSACRTPIGEFGGNLRPLQAPQLGSIAMREVIKRAHLEDQMKVIQDVRFGSCLEPVDAMNVSRVSALLAGIPDSVPAITVNRVCISGMAAALDASMYIQNGIFDCVLVGGVESMSNVPYVVQEARWGIRLQDREFADGLIHGLQCGSIFLPYPKDGPVEWARGKPYIMGQTAEFLALRDGWTREQQDEVALRSHNNAERANTDGTFKDEMVSVIIKDRKKGDIAVEKDEHFRPGLTMEQLAALPPAFLPKIGTVTAGNSSGINDGAAAMILMSDKKAKELGLKPLAKITGMGIGANAPEIMGRSPVPAVHDLFKRTDYKIDDFDRIEVNEAFASQYLTVEKELGLPREITNVHGSGIGLGHPVGATGCRIMTTLLYELIHSGKQTGLATLCGGGGVSMACVIEKL